MNDNATTQGVNAPEPSVYRGIAAKWLPLDEAAAILGVSAEILRLFARGEGARPMLASRQVKGRLAVRPGEAFDHLLANARCKSLMPPPGYGPETASPAAELPSGELDERPESDDVDLVGLLHRLVNDLRREASRSGIGPEQLRAITGAVGTIERVTREREKAALRLPPEDVRKMLQGLGDCWALHTQDHLAPNASARIVKFIHETFDVDLRKHNVEILGFLTAEIQDEANGTIAAVQRAIDDQCAGIRKLELERGEEDPLPSAPAFDPEAPGNHHWIDPKDGPHFAPPEVPTP